ncbi:hypothetical protein L1987_80762 [Smallanthus sonchifolius]|uniref:Uncharacterized protein n=1 Tax=Smallanthus sonchifolius TaxID=185202 RepID=A0ACB8YPP2_9ASTR|nr:hypothetical protein L1987_80762 [Smallanthus sonchifolius]
MHVLSVQPVPKRPEKHVRKSVNTRLVSSQVYQLWQIHRNEAKGMFDYRKEYRIDRARPNGIPALRGLTSGSPDFFSGDVDVWKRFGETRLRCADD